MAKRKYFAAFVGTLGNAPDRLRERMAAAVNSTGLPNRLGKFGDWKEIMRDTKLQLVPRGFGRTSYHLIETLQVETHRPLAIATTRPRPRWAGLSVTARGWGIPAPAPPQRQPHVAAGLIVTRLAPAAPCGTPPGHSGTNYPVLFGGFFSWLASVPHTCTTAHRLKPTRCAAVLKMGLIPIHIFSDIPWVPYGDLLAKHVFVTSIEGLAAVIDTAKALSDNELATREAAITSLRKSHFEWDGTSAWILIDSCLCLAT